MTRAPLKKYAKETIMSEEALRRFKNEFIFPIGINITGSDKEVTEVEVVAVWGNVIKAFPITRVVYKESAFGSSYNYMNGYDVRKTRYEVTRSCRHNLLSSREREIAFHWKFDAGFQSVDAYELFSSVIEAMKGDFNQEMTENGAWKKICDYNGSIVNFLVDEGAKKQKDMTFLLETLESHVSIHPDNLSEAKLLFIENLRTYKVWGEQQ